MNHPDTDKQALAVFRIRDLNAPWREIMEERVLFGEITFMHKSSVHFHSLRTLTECEIIVFPNTLLDDIAFCREYPHLILNLVKSLGVKGGGFFSQSYRLSSKLTACLKNSFLTPALKPISIKPMKTGNKTPKKTPAIRPDQFLKNSNQMNQSTTRLPFP